MIGGESTVANRWSGGSGVELPGADKVFTVEGAWRRQDKALLAFNFSPRSRVVFVYCRRNRIAGRPRGL